MVPKERIQQDFIRAASTWLLSYAELTYDEVSLQPPDAVSVIRASKIRNDLYAGLMQALKSLYPELVFEYALSQSDFIHNASWLVYSVYMGEYEAALADLETTLQEISRELQVPMEFQGSIANLELIIKSHRRLNLVWPEFSMSGPDALVSWRKCFGNEDKGFQGKWLTKVSQQYEIARRSKFAPPLLGLPENDATVFTVISNAKHIKNLAHTFNVLRDRGIVHDTDFNEVNALIIELDKISSIDQLYPYLLTSIAVKLNKTLGLMKFDPKAATDFIKKNPNALFPVANIRSIHMNGYPLPNGNRRYQEYIRDLADWSPIKDEI